MGVGPTLKASFYLKYSFKGPMSKYSHILNFWVFGRPQMNLGEHNQPITNIAVCIRTVISVV